MGAGRNALRVIGALAVAVSIAAAGGCQNKLADENKALWQQNRELQSKYAEAQSAPKSDPAEVQQLQQQLAERDQRLAELQQKAAATQPSAASNDPAMAGVTKTFDPATGDMTVTVPGDVLFDAGRATLKESSKATLQKIAASIKKEYAGKHVFVDGYTDSDPITKTKSLWRDNLDLSAARARAVMDYLKTQGIDPSKLEIRAFGSARPKQTKEASRRVELVVATR